VRHASLDDFFAHFEHILQVVGPSTWASAWTGMAAVA
jgi:hypothetical protein